MPRTFVQFKDLADMLGVEIEIADRLGGIRGNEVDASRSNRPERRSRYRRHLFQCNLHTVISQRECVKEAFASVSRERARLTIKRLKRIQTLLCRRQSCKQYRVTSGCGAAVNL